MTTALVDTRLWDNLPQHMPSTVTLYSKATSRDSFSDSANEWTAVPGMVDIACAVGIADLQRAAGSSAERRGSRTIDSDSQRILLAGFYAATTDMQAVADGVTYEIVGVAHDVAGATTRLDVQAVEE
jgi:hypothetical protein